MIGNLPKIFWRAVVRFNEDGGMANASNVALSLLLSLFPFLMLVATLVRLWGNPSIVDEIFDLVLGHLPRESAKVLSDQLKVLVSENPGEFFSIGTFAALIIATNGVENARDGLNRAYKVREERSFFWRRVQGFFFVLGGAFGLIVAAFILVATPVLWAFAVEYFPFLSRFSLLVFVAKFSVAIAILMLTLFAFHRLLAAGKRRMADMFWGILLTIVGILLGSHLFSIYLQTIANYTALYAGLAGMMIAIVYLYGLAALVLFGAEFNAALMSHREKE